GPDHIGACLCCDRSNPCAAGPRVRRWRRNPLSPGRPGGRTQTAARSVSDRAHPHPLIHRRLSGHAFSVGTALSPRWGWFLPGLHSGASWRLNLWVSFHFYECSRVASVTEATPFQSGFMRQVLTPVLLQRRVAHTEAGAEVLRKQFNGGPVGLWVRLSQVLQSLHQQTLAFHIAWVGLALTFTGDGIGPYGNGKYFSHDKNQCLRSLPLLSAWMRQTIFRV